MARQSGRGGRGGRDDKKKKKPKKDALGKADAPVHFQHHAVTVEPPRPEPTPSPDE